MGAIWYTVPGFCNYEISDQLDVRHKVFRKVKKFYVDDKGYLRTNMMHADGRNRKPGQHQIVAWTFIPNPENKPEVNHRDGNKLNNALYNLEWATQAENKKHASENELMSHKLKKANVILIRQRYHKGDEEVLAAEFGVSKSTILSIVAGRTRKNVDGPIYEASKCKKIIDLSTGIIYASVEDVAVLTGRSIKSLRRAISGERYNKTQYRYVGEEDVVKMKIEKPIPESPIGVFDLNWKLLNIYYYTPEAAKACNTDVSGINDFLTGKCSQVKGYRFKKFDREAGFIDPIPFVSKKPPLKPKRIRQAMTPSKPMTKYDENGTVIARYASAGSVARSLGIDKRNFRSMITKGRPGYYKGYFYFYDK